MEKKIAKVFKKYGGKKILVIKNYTAVGTKGTTTAIACTRRNFNQTIGEIMLSGSKKETKSVALLLKGDLYEDWDSSTSTIIKY